MLQKHDLKIENIRGQAYDGAANMSGNYSAVQSRIIAENKKAIYVHCHAHVLNLVLVDTCSQNTITKNFFGTVEAVYVFLEASTKRHAMFVQAQHDCDISRPVTLKCLSDTCWSCRVDSLRALNTSFPAVIRTLQKISQEDTNGRIASEAMGLLSQVCKFQFILAFVTLLDLLLHSKSLSDYLQRKDIDFISATDMVESLRSVLEEKSSDASFDEYYSIAQAKCSELGIVEQDEPLPRFRRVSLRIDSAPLTQHHYRTAKDQYKIEYFFDTLDIMITTLKNRFSRATCEILQAFAILHPLQLKLLGNNTSQVDKLMEFYGSDIDSRSFKTATTSEVCLSSLLLLSIERELTRQINYDAVIDAFASKNHRRLSL